MPYRIDGAEFQQGVFAVPNCVAEGYLRLAGGLSLKVLLWMLRRGSEPLDVDAIAKALGKEAEDIMDALEYWIARDLVFEDGKEPSAPPVEGSPAEPVPSPAPIATVPAIAPQAVAVPQALPQALRPTGTQIADRLEESPELRWLFREEAPKKLGHTIGYDGQSSLLMLHDTYGLPVEVIPMLLQYCVEAGKTSYSYIEAVGQDWGCKEIDSIEKADEQIASLKQSHCLWSELRRLAGLQAPRPTGSQSDYLRRWQKEFGYGIEMIHAAYEEMAEHTGKLSFAYMHKVLKKWHEAGVKTPEDAERVQEEWKASNSSRSGKKTSAGKKSAGAVALDTPPSYDLDEYERSTWRIPTFTKKEGA